MNTQAMNRKRPITRGLVAAAFALGAAGLLLPAAASADPPAWGYRGHHRERDHARTVIVRNNYYFRGDDDGYYGRRPAYRYGYRQPYAYAYGSAPVYTSAGADRTLIGGLIGAALGGALGSNIGKGNGQLAATAATALLGFVVGGNVGRYMDQADQLQTAQVLETAPSNETVAWVNPDTQARYEVTPVRTYESGGRYCREYTTQAAIGGRLQEVYGTACRQPDGSWEALR